MSNIHAKGVSIFKSAILSLQSFHYNVVIKKFPFDLIFPAVICKTWNQISITIQKFMKNILFIAF
jgi:hypothetical protein